MRNISVKSVGIWTVLQEMSFLRYFLSRALVRNHFAIFGTMRNISVKLIYIWTSGLGGDVS